MKTIALFGASGKTGKHILEKALNQGYHVKALVRDPQKMTIGHTHLTLIKGDVLIKEDVWRTIEGAEAVVSAFGHVQGSPEWLQTNGTKNIVLAMKAMGVRRIVSLSGGGLPFPEMDQPRFADKLIRVIMKVAVPKILNDAIQHANVLRDSQLDWTIVRGPRLTDQAESAPVKVGWVGVNTSMKLSRASLGTFILAQIEDRRFIGQMPMISDQ